MKRRWVAPAILGLVAIMALIGSLWLRSMLPEAATPERAEAEALTPSSSMAATSTAPQSNVATETEEPISIKESSILSVSIPAVKIDAKASGETWPRRSERCHASSTCIDPPIFREVAWYGAYARPSLPSEDSVLLFGHSNWINRDNQAFNNLPAVEAGDKVIVTTKTGRFVYKAKKPVLVDYDKIASSELVFGHVPNLVVLVTCNSAEDAATVVVADLVSAEPT